MRRPGLLRPPRDPRQYGHCKAIFGHAPLFALALIKTSHSAPPRRSRETGLAIVLLSSSCLSRNLDQIIKGLPF